MGRIISIGVMVLLTVSVVSAAGIIAKKAGPYSVEMSMDRNPPVAGRNNADITVKDASGKAVIDAKVTVDYSMPAMPGMPAMNYKSEAEFKGGIYRTVISPSMAGSWNIAVRVSRTRENGYGQVYHRRKITHAGATYVILCKKNMESRNAGAVVHPAPLLFVDGTSPSPLGPEGNGQPQ